MTNQAGRLDKQQLPNWIESASASSMSLEILAIGGSIIYMVFIFRMFAWLTTRGSVNT